MRIVNMPRFIISITVIVLVLSFFTSMLTNKVFSATPVNYNEITVSEGDTLWSIAMSLGGNVSKNIYEIKEVNNLNNSMIFVGQTLLVPSVI